MKKRLAIIGGSLVAVGLIGGLAWYFLKGNEESSDQNDIYVTTVATLMGDVAGTQNRYSGVVEPQKTVEVKLENNRTVSEVKVEEGQTVKAGDLLFEYDASSSQDDLAQAELDLERYKNDAISLASQIETLKDEKTKASSEEQLSYTISIQEAEMDLKKNEYSQKSKQAEIEKLKKASQSTEVVSELDGVIKKIDTSLMNSGTSDSGIEEGYSDSGSGSSNAFITIVGTGTYRVKGKVNETNASSIIPGDPVIVRSRVDSDVTWTGTMTGVDTDEQLKNDTSNSFMDSGNSDEQTTSTNYPFYVQLDSADGLMLGQHVYIEMDYGQDEIKPGIWLNEFYIVDADAEPYVWASDSKDKLEKRSIVLGDYDEALGKYEITEGLSKNDCIAFPDDSYEEGMKTTINDSAQMPNSDPGVESGDEGMDSSMDSGMDSGFDSGVDSGSGPDDEGIEIIEGEFSDGPDADEGVEP